MSHNRSKLNATFLERSLSPGLKVSLLSINAFSLILLAVILTGVTIRWRLVRSYHKH